MIIVITSRTLCREPLPERLRKIASAKPDLVVLRERDLDDAQYRALAIECADVLDGIPLAVHSRACVAAELGAKWLWLPFTHRQECPRHIKKIVSIHSEDEAAAVTDAEYVVAGHIFATSCKPDAPARGLDFLRGIVRTSPRSVLAIGGITPENARECVEAGAAGVCVMSSTMTSPDPEGLIARIREALK